MRGSMAMKQLTADEGAACKLYTSIFSCTAATRNLLLGITDSLVFFFLFATCRRVLSLWLPWKSTDVRFSFFLCYLSSLTVVLTTQIHVVQGEQQTVDQNTTQMVGLAKCVVSTMSGPPRETT